MIPSIVITRPIVMLSLERTGAWNFADLANLFQNNNEKPPLEIYLTGLTIFNGTTIIFDKNIAPDPIETIDNINIHASLALPDSVKATIKIFPKKQGALKVFSDLNFNFLSKDFLCQLRAENVNLEKIAAYAILPGFVLQKAKINIASLDLSRRSGKISGKGEIIFDPIKVLLEDKTSIACLPVLKLDDMTIVNEELRLQGLLDLKQGEVLLEQDKKITTDISYAFVASRMINKIAVQGTLTAPNLSGQFGPKANITAQVQGKTDFVYADGLFQGQSQLKLQNTRISLPPDIQVTGNPLIDISLSSQSPKTEVTQSTYKVSITVTDAKAINLPALQTADNISGKATFEPNKISVESLSAVVNQTPVALSGVVENFKNPFLNITFNAKNLNLGAWTGLINQYLPELNLDAKGIATIDLKYRGTTKQLAGATIDCTASLKDVAFKTKLIADGIFDVSGDIRYMIERFNPSHFLPDQGSWNNLRFTFQDKPYLLNGTLQFNNLLTTLKRDDLHIDLTSKIFPERLTILSLTGQYHESNMSAQGEIFYPKEKQQGPRFNIKMKGKLLLEDLSSLFPELKEKLLPIAPQGLCLIDGLFAGNPQQWRDWALVLNITSKEASFYHYKFNQLSIKYVQRDRFINECTLGSLFYNGVLAMQGSSDLSIPETPYKINVDIKDVNLASLKKDTPLKDKDLSGLASLTYAGTGPLSNLNFSQGQGFLSIKNGKLWQFDVFKGLAQMLFVPEHENITLDSAESNFSVVNEKVIVKDAIIKGNQVELTCNGAVTFKGDLDFDIVSQFAEGVIRSSDSLQKTIAAFLAQAEDILTVKVTGTIQEPKYKVTSKPLNVIQKTKDFIIDTLPNIFQ